MTAEHHQIPPARRKRASLYVVPTTWTGVDRGERPAGVVDCTGHDLGHDRFLCPDCEYDFRRHLRDIPGLLVELDVAITKQVRFPERGHSRDQVVVEEAPVSFNGKARDAMMRLVDALHYPSRRYRDLADRYPVRCGTAASRWMAAGALGWLRNPDVPEIASELSRAVVAARRAIDRPRDLVFYGVCAGCSSDIRQDRIDVEDRAATINCERCGYSEKFADHLLASLDAGDDRWLTIDELVGAIEHAPGETVTRSQILRWRDHQGLPRDVRVVPSLEGVSLQVEVFRLGDVRVMAARDAEERGSLTSADLAVRWSIKPEQIKLLVHRGRLSPIRANAKPLRFTRAEVERYESVR